MRSTLGITASVVAVVLAIGLLVALEEHRGYFAPVWDDDGRHVYVLERRTRGIVWGMGWEFFSPPASSYVLSDDFHVIRLDSRTGTITIRADVSGSPLTGRTTKHYRGRIFNTLSARIEPGEEGCTFLIKMSIPRVPSAEQWSLAGSCGPASPPPEWRASWGGSTGRPDATLKSDVELLTVPGREAFPSAVLAVAADGGYRVLLENDAFRTLYPNGVASAVIETQSIRRIVERGRELERVRTMREADYRQRGLSEHDAALRTYEDMESVGYFPMRPRLVAAPVTERQCDAATFEITPDRFQVGLFQDIAAALDQPGEPVLASTGTYLKYYDDETGPELKAWRDAGNDRFCVRVGDALYLLSVRRRS